MKFIKFLFVIISVELFCILSVTSAANFNNVLKNSGKFKNHVEKKLLSIQEETANKDGSHTQISKDRYDPTDNPIIIKFQDQVYHVIDHTKSSLKRPELSQKETGIPRRKETRDSINYIRKPQVNIPGKPRYTFSNVMPINPRVKLNKAIRRMDQYLQWNNSCSMESLSSPVPPDFRRHVQRISEAKCLEYIWKIKAEEEIDRRLDTCYRQNAVYLSRIPNGVDAIYGEFPHMGAVGWLASDEAKEKYDDDYIFMCGSTLLSENFALTASHCAQAPIENKLVQPGALKPKIVRFGVEKLYKQEPYRSRQDAVIAAFIPYPDRDNIHKVHDLALIKFEEPVYFTSLVRPACIVPQSFKRAQRATVSGWGITKRTSSLPAKELQKTDVNILDNRLCNRKLRPRMKSSGWHGLNQQICATNLEVQTDACQGDSGGPLQETLKTGTESSVYNVLAVVAFNFVCASTKVPSIYTKIDHKDYMDWIEDNVWGDNINNKR